MPLELQIINPNSNGTTTAKTTLHAPLVPDIANLKRRHNATDSASPERKEYDDADVVQENNGWVNTSDSATSLPSPSWIVAVILLVVGTC